jgi:hypothetical protein
MDSKLLALKLFLDTLQVPPSIATVDDRKRVQKAIYLGQRIGHDLGYRYNWYVMGPYSPALTQDYYQLAEVLESGDVANGTLRSDVAEKLQRALPLLRVPETVKLDQAGWLELVASYDYLRAVSRYTHDKAVELLNQQKPHVSKHVDAARQALEAAGLKLQ